MKLKTITTILLVLVTMTGQAQIKCHVVGTVADGVERQTFYIAQQSTADYNNKEWMEVNVKDGCFALDIEAEKTEMYEIIEDHFQGGHFALFLLENDTVRIDIKPDDDGARLEVVAGGPEQEKWLKMQRMSKDIFFQEAEALDHKLDSMYDNDLLYSEAYNRLMEERKTYDRANPDHVHALEVIYARRDSMLHD